MLRPTHEIPDTLDLPATSGFNCLLPPSAAYFSELETANPTANSVSANQNCGLPHCQPELPTPSLPTRLWAANCRLQTGRVTTAWAGIRQSGNQYPPPQI